MNNTNGPDTSAQSEIGAVQVINAQGRSPYVILCEHASSHIPPAYGDLGLPEAERLRHIAWDIGARDMAIALARRLDAVLVLGTVSRLVIDLNRPLYSSSSIPEISETTVIPGNTDLSLKERTKRHEHWFHPFHETVTAILDERAARKKRTLLLGIHTFTPVFKGERRPWAAGILFGHARSYGRLFIEALHKASHFPVAENFPYQIELDEDYAVPVHGDGRNLPACLVEIRQDLVADETGVTRWASFLATAAREVEQTFDGQGAVD
ncbi:N-formylglutamate amidohydrolase [Novacetimonas pomaceti]|uniref:N-formylglutamate amidohydrolase n=1 Tax=Novacetimonas pomaceti TaxID=2021998 RepID=UPI001C2CF193|nr:N-formylglutamate amidohydrolase [Novacetimonas pomaceti]MBV1833726.1 N-formylglutamate amidohydrolase [Novacetimonas pomaceti]